MHYISEQSKYKGAIERELVRIHPMPGNEMCYTLIKKSMYVEAKAIAKEMRIPKEISSEILKEYGDKLFQ